MRNQYRAPIPSEEMGRVRVQLEHMQQQGRLVDWVLEHYPADELNKQSAFGKALALMRDSLRARVVADSGGTCPICGREINGASGGIIHTGNRDGVAVRQAGANPASPTNNEPRFNQPPEEIEAVRKDLGYE